MPNDDLVLDGMPEIPPAWVRPDSGVRLAAQDLDWMLQAALPHAGTDEDELPVLCSILLSVANGLLTTVATDRFTMIRERRPISQTCPDFTFLLRTADASSLRVLLKQVLRGLKDEARTDEPIDLAVEQTDDGPTLRVLGQDLDVRFTEVEQTAAAAYPTYDSLLNNILLALDNGRPGPFDTALNPTLLARVVPLQRAGRISSAFRWTSAGSTKTRRPVVVRPVDNADPDPPRDPRTRPPVPLGRPVLRRGEGRDHHQCRCRPIIAPDRPGQPRPTVARHDPDQDQRSLPGLQLARHLGRSGMRA